MAPAFHCRSTLAGSVFAQPSSPWRSGISTASASASRRSRAIHAAFDRLCALPATGRPPPACPAGNERVDGRNIRRSLNQTGRYVRQPTNDPVSQQLMEDHGVGYSLTGLVAQMRGQGNLWEQGEVTVKLAKAYGYCWGVERAVRMAYEARQAFPGRKVHITNEIIHNPEVNSVSGGAGGGQLLQAPLRTAPCQGEGQGEGRGELGCVLQRATSSSGCWPCPAPLHPHPRRALEVRPGAAAPPPLPPAAAPEPHPACPSCAAPQGAGHQHHRGGGRGQGLLGEWLRPPRLACPSALHAARLASSVLRPDRARAQGAPLRSRAAPAPGLAAGAEGARAPLP
jgi:hypothetical protein